MKIEQVKTADLVPYLNNAKKHDRKQIENVAASIRKYGFVQPIVVDRNDEVIIGHCRLMAAKLLGLDEVPCLRAEDLTDEQVKELRLIDNKTNESPWDVELLQIELESLDLGDFDFDWGIPKKDDEVVEVPVPEDVESITGSGECWHIGDHILLCGDSTNPDHVRSLMGDELADCVCTDPPYNMGYQGAGRTPKAKRERNKILNDSLPDDEFDIFLAAVYRNMAEVMKDKAAFYVFYKELGHAAFIRALQGSGLTFKQELIWVKNQLVMGGAQYQNMYEPCLYGCKGKNPKWYTGRKERSVIESVDLMSDAELRATIKELTEREATDIIRERKTQVNDLHPTMKLVRLIAKLLNNSTAKNDIVLDLFGGSGSTLMACEQMGRKCRIMEMDPHYCDVIVRRWEDFTGRKAYKEERHV